jgi:hypothetical protein
MGDTRRPFTRLISPLARLLDFLADKYNLLFLVSGGNVPGPLEIPGFTSWGPFESATANGRARAVIAGLNAAKHERTILSPSESLNALTVGDSVSLGVKRANADCTPAFSSGVHSTTFLPTKSRNSCSGTTRFVFILAARSNGLSRVMKSSRVVSKSRPCSMVAKETAGRFDDCERAIAGAKRMASASNVLVARAIAGTMLTQLFRVFPESRADHAARESWGTLSKPMERMVGTRRLEPQTSTVSRSCSTVTDWQSTALAATFGVVGNSQELLLDPDGNQILERILHHSEFARRAGAIAFTSHKPTPAGVVSSLRSPS